MLSEDKFHAKTAEINFLNFLHFNDFIRQNTLFSKMHAKQYLMKDDIVLIYHIFKKSDTK